MARPSETLVFLRNSRRTSNWMSRFLWFLVHLSTLLVFVLLWLQLQSRVSLERTDRTRRWGITFDGDIKVNSSRLCRWQLSLCRSISSVQEAVREKPYVRKRRGKLLGEKWWTQFVLLWSPSCHSRAGLKRKTHDISKERERESEEELNSFFKRWWSLAF